MSRSRFESFGGRLWVYETFTILFFIFTMWIWFENIQIWGMVFISTFWIPLKFKNVIFPLCKGFKKSHKIVMHVPNLIRAWETEIFGFSPSHISLWIGSLLIEIGGNRYSQWRHNNISWDWESVSYWVIQRTCDYEICGRSNSFSGIWYMFL